MAASSRAETVSLLVPDDDGTQEQRSRNDRSWGFAKTVAVGFTVRSVSDTRAPLRTHAKTPRGSSEK